MIHPTALEIFRILAECDSVPPSASQQSLEQTCVRRAARLLDEALPWQRGHGQRTAYLAQRLGLTAGFDSETLHHLTLAALLHDIGLLALPSSLVSPAGYLDFHSYAARQSHPRLGAQWLDPYRFLRQASVIIAHHHERWDGSGYPYGMRGTTIPIEARVLAIADAFDAIEVVDADDHKMRDEAAYRIIRSASGTQFDAQLVDLCPLAYSHESRPSEHPHQSCSLTV
ncbi:MAG TPA: HD domain-containing phosphohydrolase [Nitrospiraceae bacterium]|jgi:HD-GYP domain-containing protein (c-di-GMP phosphodiesterase class II)|nr:HD domain-containing phosphohydrolase [Nitrospiraceae bacterium]